VEDGTAWTIGFLKDTTVQMKKKDLSPNAHNEKRHAERSKTRKKEKGEEEGKKGEGKEKKDAKK